MFGVAESRTAVVFGTNYSTISSANDWEDDWDDDGIDVEYLIHNVPGAFEIPFLINISRNLFDGFIALGCIIRGETYHFELISNEVIKLLRKFVSLTRTKQESPTS